MIGQKAEQEGHCYHGDQVYRAASVTSPSVAGQVAAVGAGVGRQVPHDPAVAKDDGEEGEQEAENHRNVV